MLRLALILAVTLPMPALAQQQRPTPVGKFDTAKKRALDTIYAGKQRRRVWELVYQRIAGVLEGAGCACAMRPISICL
jgi:hypothetical protein